MPNGQTSRDAQHGSVRQLAYISRAVRPMPEHEVVRLQQRAGATNAESGITGLLLVGNGHFLQLIEGPPAEIERVFTQRISGDRRHERIEVVLDRESTERLAEHWSMGVLDLRWDAIEAADDASLALADIAARVNEATEHRPSEIFQIFEDALRSIAA
ncbi:MAG: BLUF domain-containing protein [Planctomycetota bacterium]